MRAQHLTAAIIKTAVAGILLASICVSAKADVLPAATASVDCNSNNPFGDVSGSSTCALQGASASLVQFPYVSLEASVNDAAGVATQDAFATLTYYFEVIGGNAGDEVPVSIATSTFSSANYPNYAFAEVYTDGSGPDAASAIVCTDGSCPLGNSFDGTLNLTAASGQERQLTISIGAEEGFGTGGNPFASADPYIFVNPTFDEASNYSIEVSPGVGNGLAATAVPEPSSFTLLALGLAGFVGMRRRRASSVSL